MQVISKPDNIFQMVHHLAGFVCLQKSFWSTDVYIYCGINISVLGFNFIVLQQQQESKKNWEIPTA